VNMIKMVFIVSAISVSSLAMAEGGGDRVYGRMMQENEHKMQEYAADHGKTPPEVTDYEYGMTLDIAKFVNATPTDFGCEVMPAQMTYEDSSGDLQTVEYRVMGTACRD